MTVADDAAARLQAAMGAIGAQAMQSNLRRLDELDDIIVSALASPLADPDREQARSVAHQLVGSAGTFGYRRVSTRAREVELLFTSQTAIDEPQLRDALSELTQMRLDLAAGPDDD